MGKIGREVAEAEFERWAEAWDIDTATGPMAEEDRNAFQNMRDRLIRKIEQGRLEIGENGDPTFTPQFGAPEDAGPLTFHVPSGADRLAWDKYKEKENIHRIFSTLAAMTGKSTVYFSKMDGRDLKVAESIGLLYLGS